VKRKAVIYYFFTYLFVLSEIMIFAQKDLLSTTEPLWCVLEENSIKCIILIEENRAKGMSYQEYLKYIELMKKRYGDSGVRGVMIAPKEENLPEKIENAEFVTAWTYHLDLKKYDKWIAGSDNLIALYKARKYDQYYFYWFWSAAQPGKRRKLLNFWNKMEILSDESELLIYSPDSEKKVNEKPVKIGITVPIGDIVVSLETQVWIYDGRIQPKPMHCKVGEHGMFAVEWIGEYGGCQSLNGVCEEIRSGSYCFKWVIYLKAK